MSSEPSQGAARPGKKVELPDQFKCTVDRTVEAVILYPSLGMPMVLGPEQNICSLIIATGKNCWKIEDAPEYIDRHLRLTAINKPKGQCAKNTESGELCGDGTRYQIAKEAIQVWRLGNITEGRVIANRHSSVKDGECKKFPFAILAPGLTTKEGPYADLTDLWEVEIDLKNAGLKCKITEHEFMNWAWLVETTKAHRDSIPGSGNGLIRAFLGEYHEPQDRMIYSYLSRQADLETSLGRHYAIAHMYEVDLAKDQDKKDQDKKDQDKKDQDKKDQDKKDQDNYPTPLGVAGEAKRLQSWHPVIKATQLPLNLAHVSDPHISARQGALAKSPACVIEDPEDKKEPIGKNGGPPVGKKVTYTFRSAQELIRRMADKKTGMDTALLLTGDYLDFHRNIDPRKVGEEIGDQWKKLNVLANVRWNDTPARGEKAEKAADPPPDPDLYRRGFDDTMIYTLVREAYTEHKLPVFMVSGNHDGYRLPYGISPRKGMWAVGLGLRELFGRSTEKHLRKVEAASQWVHGKASEEIAAEHNLTFYEAALAYGPAYGQVLTTDNFKNEQFDWFHTLLTPFSDALLFLGAEADRNGAGAQQILALLGWGGDENYKNLGDWLPLGGVDAQGAGILPRANQSFSKAQLSLLSRASDVKGEKAIPFVLGTHFTLISYHPKTPLNKEKVRLENPPEKSVPPNDLHLTPANDAAGLPTARLWGSAFNEANWGTCEMNQREFFNKFVFGKTGKVDWHLSGHSHRAGLYQVEEYKRLGPNEVRVRLACDPGLIDPELIDSRLIDRSDTRPSRLILAEGGTRFVVSSSAGPIGVQNMRGEFDGWHLRPPSGSWIDVKEKTVEQIKTLCPENNEIPRLCVALDYLATMNPGDEIMPIQFYDADQRDPKRPFADRIDFRISESMVRLDCLDLEGMKIWLFKEADRSKTPQPGQWITLKAGPIENKKGFFGFGEESETERILDLRKATVEGSEMSALEALESCLEDPPKRAEDQDDAAWEAEVKSAQVQSRAKGAILNHFMPQKRVLQAFCEIPLKAPKIVGADEMNHKDPWIFPLAIGIVKEIEDTDSRSSRLWCYFHRPWGEKGEVPDWGFRAKYFGHKGYVQAWEIIGNKEISSDEDISNAGSTPSLPIGNETGH